MLDEIWEYFGRWSIVKISNWAYMDGSPWHTIWYKEGGSIKRNFRIREDIIKDYFKNHVVSLD
jgi:uncharacterized phage-associated protein